VFRPSIDGYDTKTLNHHINYLFDEGMIEGQDVTVWSSEGTEIMIQSITPGGGRYLDSLAPEPEVRRLASARCKLCNFLGVRSLGLTGSSQPALSIWSAALKTTGSRIFSTVWSPRR
jgi:hypothetical protein